MIKRLHHYNFYGYPPLPTPICYDIDLHNFTTSQHIRYYDLHVFISCSRLQKLRRESLS